jgi:hypothetical protein
LELGTEADDDLVLKLISAAVLAGAYRSLAAFMPEAKSGLLKMAARHSARVATHADEVSERATESDYAPVARPMPGDRRARG